MNEAHIQTTMNLQGMGGYLSVGDLDGDGNAEYVVTQGTRHLAAFDADGTLMWKKRRKEYGQVRVHVECEMPTVVYDIDGDGRAEVIARWYLEDTRDAVPFIFILDGETGEIRYRAALPIHLWPESVLSMAHSGNIVVGHIEVDRPPHLIVGGMCWGLAILDHELRLRFCDPQFGRVHDRMTGFGLCHTPQLFDVDGDGVNELFLGRTTCRADGEILWEIDPEEFSPAQIDHVDSLAVGDLDEDGRFEVAASNAASLFDAHTGELLWQHPDLVHHGQQLRVARVRDDVEGRQILVRAAKRGAVQIFSADGHLLESLEHGGMLCPLNWSGNGLQQISLGDAVFDGWGEKVATLPIGRAASASGHSFPPEDPESWGHTMTCDVDGDGLEEVIWLSKTCLAVFGNPDPPEDPEGVERDREYWLGVANATRY